jgi:outer membrane protein insertion porin family
LVGFVELTQGNFDLFNWPAFTGAGQKFRLRLQYGTQRKDFILSLTEPYFLDRRLALSGQLFYTEANYLSAEYDQRNYGFTVELRKPLNAYMYATLGYRLQDVDIFDVAASASNVIQEAKGSTVESQIFTSVVYDRRDNPLLTRRGQRITLSPYVAGGFLGGDAQIYGWDLEGSQYFRLWWDTILLFNGEVATVNTWGGGDTVPIFDRLYLGGSNNLRGFPFREVGPQDHNGEPIGGNSMARLTVEYTFPLIQKARGAVFYDTGFVNSDAWSFGFNHIASDVGIGLRLDLPIGPLRLDYGFPIQRDGYNGGGHFNFNVGYQF